LFVIIVRSYQIDRSQNVSNEQLVFHASLPTAHERLGFVPTPVVASNCVLGGSTGRRLFIAATQYLLAIDLNA
jgi:sugar lactone lactonase YvrE